MSVNIEGMLVMSMVMGLLCRISSQLDTLNQQSETPVHKNQDDPKGLVLAAICIVLGIVVIITVWLFCCRRTGKFCRKKRQRQEEKGNELKEITTGRPALPFMDKYLNVNGETISTTTETDGLIDDEVHTDERNTDNGV